MKNVWVYLSDTQRLAKQPEQLRMVLAVTLEQRAQADFLGLAKSLETFYTPFFKCVHELETNKNDLIQKTNICPLAKVNPLRQTFPAFPSDNNNDMQICTLTWRPNLNFTKSISEEKRTTWLKNPLLEKKLHKIRNLRLLNKLPITLCNFQPSFSNTRRDDLLFPKVNLIHDTVTL